MSKPIIEWFILEDDSTVQATDYYAGTCTNSKQLKVKMQIWNNRYGTEDVGTISDAVLIASFDNIEDAALLQYLHITINESDGSTFIVRDNVASAVLGVTLSGNKNDGDDTISDNHRNFVTVLLEFIIPEGITTKQNDLKKMYLSVQPL